VKGSTYVSRLEREFVSEASNEKTNFKNETKDAARIAFGRTYAPTRTRAPP